MKLGACVALFHRKDGDDNLDLFNNGTFERRRGLHVVGNSTHHNTINALVKVTKTALEGFVF
jgi:hypothetical protein